MNTDTLARLNRRLGDCRGRNPHGLPVYCWLQSSSPLLTYPALDSETGTRWVDLRQLDDDRWVLAQWYPPPSESEWRTRFPSLGYPAQGMYSITNKILREGVEPTDTLTDGIIGGLRLDEKRTFKDFIDEFAGKRAARDRARQAVVSDAVDDAVTAFGNLPGSRAGSVSFGGYDVPLISTTTTTTTNKDN